MEKLQRAIEKARAQRDGEVKERQKPSEDISPVPTSVEEAWDALPTIQFKSGTLHRNRIVTPQSGAISAPFDLLRTRMLRQAKTHGWRRIAFVSPHSSCGKTTTVANLAFSLARQTSIRTLVFDFDLRRRGLTELFRQKPTYGMADVLEGRVSFADHALRYGKNVAFGFNLESTQTASEILQSQKTQAILDEIQNDYQPDLMLFDMPPLMASDDNFGFLHNVDAALLLVAAEKTTMSQIDVAERQVADLTNVMGIVLNKCRYTDGAHGHEYNSYY
ncbi:CpsD/CapB family tyrosine-protein kinase [Marimonas arenosa]|uniref:CpsD/CapB family tyrosine-protein kinase n=1 Tax=Marimonas arenosa TaxID=1795305 RepID=A0AAE4B3Y0_9RHOB|nr:CpsD/CapB family tyrosine-protein kinase [Marimonas arenosa]MDQ2089660.1 CpsD/CapB family tyrosine-protein kinase [Marimonas arenosa]